ncbi:hypothetical protein GOV04_05955 [Candidatus Woesearchaeota archaeon]|nr:hypothetical protein [Candidatus Woesearchaeota archaeon]
MSDKDKILQLVRQRGPLLPIDISKALGMTTIFSSAYLSELVDSKVLRLSSVKVGSSPLYYAPGQEHKLQNYKSKLHEKEQLTYEILKKEGVLRDEGLSTLNRVALRQIKDFAIPLEVQYGEVTELFFKWYMLDDNTASEKIKKILAPLTSKPAPVPEKPKEVVQKPSVVQEKPEAPKPKPAPVVAEPKIFKDTTKTDDFSDQLKNYFAQKNIKIVERDIIRKNSEIDYVLLMPTAIGSVEYYCKAKSKKKNNDGDLSVAYLQGQMKKLPTIFLTTGEITKKALEKSKQEFKGMVIKQI